MSEEEKEILKQTKVNNLENNVLIEVAKILSKSNKTVVRAKVVDALVEKELERRAQLIMSALTLYEKVNDDLKKIKPDSKVYDIEGKIISEGYSENASKNKTALTKKLEDLNLTISNALEKNDYQKIEQMIKNA